MSFILASLSLPYIFAKLIPAFSNFFASAPINPGTSIPNDFIVVGFIKSAHTIGSLPAAMSPATVSNICSTFADSVIAQSSRFLERPYAIAILSASVIPLFNTLLILSCQCCQISLCIS